MDVRIKTAIYLSTVGIAFLFGGLIMCLGGLDEHLKNLQYENEGVQTEAQLIGYQYVSQSCRGCRSGDRPLLAYKDHDSNAYVHLAMEYGAVGEYGKRTLPSKKFL